MKLRATVVLDARMDLSLAEVAGRIGEALGIVLGEDVEGIYEELNALTAVVLGHHFAVYREPEDSIRPYAGRIVLQVKRYFHWGGVEASGQTARAREGGSGRSSSGAERTSEWSVSGSHRTAEGRAAGPVGLLDAQDSRLR